MPPDNDRANSVRPRTRVRTRTVGAMVCSCFSSTIKAMRRRAVARIKLESLSPSHAPACSEIPNHQTTMKKGKPIVSDMLNEARRDMSDVIEEIGAACTHLREAMDFAENGSKGSATGSVDDALDAIDRAIEEIHKVRDRAGRWADGLGSQNATAMARPDQPPTTETP